MYEGIICKVVNVRKHPNADRLNLATVAGHQVVISKNIKEGTLGVFFPCDGRLTTECLRENNLYRHKHLNKDPEATPGFFGDNGRIRAQKFRNAISEGFWTGLDTLVWTKIDLSSLKEGDKVHKVNGHVVCEKYYTPATMRAMKAKDGKTSKKKEIKESFPDFKEHRSTAKLRMAIQFIPRDAVLYFSEKCHGTSGRTGYLPARKRLSRFKQLWNKTIGKTGLIFKDHEYKYVTGTRRVVVNTKKVDQGFYAGKSFRRDIHNKIVAVGLRQGETLYYEIVGFDDTGKSIMPAHKPKDKALKKKHGDNIWYSYGCDQNSNQYKVLVYRITTTTPDGSVVEMPDHQVTTRCLELGLQKVPSISRPMVYDGDKDVLMERCEALSQGESTLDPGHIKEGVVIKVEHHESITAYKYKGFWFCELEGIMKNDDSYVDPEEIA